MVSSQNFIKELEPWHLSPWLMVPCSIFKPLSNWLEANNREVIYPPNEAHAMGFAVGTYCVSGRPAVIFMQNSGLNNTANAQTSLNYLYQIPVLLVISWRGEPGRKDAPEHEIMGSDLKVFLKILRFPFRVLGQNWPEQLKQMVHLAKKSQRPTVVVIREGFFEKEEHLVNDLTNKYALSRLESIGIIKNYFRKKAVFISTNGFTSRDSFACSPTPDFYMMGSMGHAFSIGAGIVWSGSDKQKLRTVVFDGDGGCLMHLGSLAMVGLERVRKGNLIYVLLDNEAYESTGAQPTLSSKVNFLKIAQGFGFPQIFSAKNKKELQAALRKIKFSQAAFVYLKVNRSKVTESVRVSDCYTCPQIASRFKNNFF